MSTTFAAASAATHIHPEREIHPAEFVATWRLLLLLLPIAIDSQSARVETGHINLTVVVVRKKITRVDRVDQRAVAKRAHVQLVAGVVVSAPLHQQGHHELVGLRRLVERGARDHAVEKGNE